MKRLTSLLVFGVAIPMATAVMLSAAHGHAAPLVLKNVTPSMPLGLYRRIDRPIVVGSVVAVHQPTAARAYLRELGFPQEALLLKRVADKAPDRVCSAGGRMWSDRGWAVGRLHQDRLGRRLPTWDGCGRLSSNDLLLLGDDARSFDSRYFGPVGRQLVVGVYERFQ